MKIGDIIKYPVFYRGFNIMKEGIIASEIKMVLGPSGEINPGYDILGEDNKIHWVWEHNIEEVK